MLPAMRKSIVVKMMLAALAAAAPGLGAASDVYRWTDKDGVVHYSDKPLAPDAKPAELPPLQTFKPSGAPAVQTAPGAPSSAPAADGGVTITAPAAEETIRDSQGTVTVNVTASPGNGGLIYYLDGAAQNPSPTPSTAFLLNGVERGAHKLAVALVGPDGSEITRSATINFYVMPPRVGMSPATRKPH
jgi:S-formylglutathione hydrolase FrmB